jgi:hypothetical protein
MAKDKRECGCPRKVWRCHHELAEVRAKAASKLTPEEVKAAKQLLNRGAKRKRTKKPPPIIVLPGGAPGTGKRR